MPFDCVGGRLRQVMRKVCDKRDIPEIPQELPALLAALLAAMFAYSPPERPRAAAIATALADAAACKAEAHRSEGLVSIPRPTVGRAAPAASAPAVAAAAAAAAAPAAAAPAAAAAMQRTGSPAAGGSAHVDGSGGSGTGGRRFGSGVLFDGDAMGERLRWMDAHGFSREAGGEAGQRARLATRRDDLAGIDDCRPAGAPDAGARAHMQAASNGSAATVGGGASDLRSDALVLDAKVERLCEMGFSGPQAREALAACQGDVHSAATQLLEEC